MRVQRVLMPGSEAESWTLLGEDHVPVEPVARFLAFLSAIERSPNTVKAYAHDLNNRARAKAGRLCPFTGGPWCQVVAGVGSHGLPVRALWMASMARMWWPRVLTR